jgi:hypothetical protein
VKGVEGSVIETHSSREAKIREGAVEIPFRFQLVSKQFVLKGDGLLGRDFLKQMQAQICYQNRTLILHHAGAVVTKQLSACWGESDANHLEMGDR